MRKKSPSQVLDIVNQIKKLCITSKSAKELALLLGYKNIKYFKSAFLKPLIEKEILEILTENF